MSRPERDDACPGVLRPHQAADGALVRVRVPGGVLTPEALRALAATAREFGDGRIGLTSRGNVQVRGVSQTDVGALARRLRAAGVLPPAEHDQHEHVRNIIASPLSARTDRSLDDVDGLAGHLDVALRGRPALAALSGRFLFALDDGSGDVAGERADLRAVALGGGRFAIRPFGCARGVRVPRMDVVAGLLAGAGEFLAERAAQGSRAWRIAELADGGGRVLARMTDAGWPVEEFVTPGSQGLGEPGAAEHGLTERGPAEQRPAEQRFAEQEPAGVGRPRPGLVEPGLVEPDLVEPGLVQPGLVEQRDGRWAVCAVVALGLLEAEQAAAVAAAADLSTASPGLALRITPWRRIVLRDLHLPAALAGRELLASVGLVLAPGVGWSRITACAGRPGCAKSLTDVQQDARDFAVRCDPVGPAVHWAGCERGCGTPAGTAVVRILATAAGYQIDGELSSRDAMVLR